jgi:hypothetical protein
MQRREMDPPVSGQRAAEPVKLREVLFEFLAVGNSVKVCAIDPDTLVEATILGPVSAGETALKHAALQKLRYVLTKKRSEASVKSDRYYT